MGASSGAARKPWVPGATCVMAAAAAEPTPPAESRLSMRGPRLSRHLRTGTHVNGEQQLDEPTEQVEERHLNIPLETTAPSSPETRRLPMQDAIARLHRGSRPGRSRPERRPRRKPLRRRELPQRVPTMSPGQVVAGGNLRTRASQARTPSPSRGRTVSKDINASDLLIPPGGLSPKGGKSAADWPSVCLSVRDSNLRGCRNSCYAIGGVSWR
jgi:hypothetical protein